MKGKLGSVYFRSWVCRIKKETWVHHPTPLSLGWVRVCPATEIYASGNHGFQELREVEGEWLFRNQRGTSLQGQPQTV